MLLFKADQCVEHSFQWIGFGSSVSSSLGNTWVCILEEKATAEDQLEDQPWSVRLSSVQLSVRSSECTTASSTAVSH